VGPRAGLDTEATGKILCPRRGSNLDRPVVQVVDKTLYRLNYPAHLSYLPVIIIFHLSQPITFSVEPLSLNSIIINQQTNKNLVASQLVEAEKRMILYL
jgi:hypothetical protein